MDQLPFPSSDDPIEIAPRYRELQHSSPLTRVLTRVGDEAWLATGYDVVRQLASEPALGRSHPEPERAARSHEAALLGGPSGDFETEQEQHAQMRRLLGSAFSAKRMRLLQESIEHRVDALLEAFPSPPTDLHEALSAPLPVMVICDLLGAPVEDSERLRTFSTRLAKITDAADSHAADEEFTAYAGELLDRKRSAPGEDVFSDLAGVDGLAAAEAARLAKGLLFAGHETTMTRIDLGTLLFLRHPEQRRLLHEDPSLINSAVEEILRLTIGTGSSAGTLLRYAGEELKIDSTVINLGDAVLLGFGVANRDPAVFDRPDAFDITRQPNPHLAFGHGPHFCIGNSLARVELRAVFSRLFERYPTLHLASDQLEHRHDAIGGGLAALEVAW
ncbi:cytochrome P450 [Microlunatus speluncae]|uniref:cytochrome P450 n=1 Tax=Microlunatus speluncae TaxID=2594267 RepID=UPI00126623C9|nr:cytochrome P450 [Microlunatus speluncae]